jgi:hypothetical protein
MPRTVRIEQPADALAQLHADPTERPGLLDGLIVEGRDLFADRRRTMRERISGPDPVPPPARRKETSPMATAIRPVLPPEAPSAATRANGASFALITESEWAALKPIRGKHAGRWAALLAAVGGGRIVRIAVPADISRKGAILSLHHTARGCGLRLEIRSCPNGELAVAAINPKDGQP